MIRLILFVIAFIFNPFFWMMLNLCGARISFFEVYRELIDHHKSGDRYGVFDVSEDK